MAPAIDLRWSYPAWLEKAYAIFEEIIENGNLIAKYRRSELQLLDELLSYFPQEHTRCLSAPISIPAATLNTDQTSVQLANFPSSVAHTLSHDLLSDPGVSLEDELSLTTGLTAAQIMAVADSIESIDTEWMSNAMVEHSIW